MVITGGTSGIGLAAAREMANRGYRLILIGRDVARGQAALKSLSQAPGRSHRFISADLSLLRDVRAVVADIESSETSIDVLANNAGTWFHRRELTVEGIERTVAVNHLAYIAMTLGLKQLLLAAEQPRVINTGSFVYRQARYDPANLQSEKRFSTNATYAATKLYNLMATQALARRWVESGITINCFSPGFVATNFGRGEGGILEPFYRLARRFAVSPEKGAATLVHLAVAPELAGITGGYFVNCKAQSVTGAAADARASNELLDWTAQIAGLVSEAA